MLHQPCEVDGVEGGHVLLQRGPWRQWQGQTQGRSSRVSEDSDSPGCVLTAVFPETAKDGDVR